MAVAGGIDPLPLDRRAASRTARLWRSAALLAVLVWAATVVAAWAVTSRVGDDGVSLQATSFAPRPEPDPGDPVAIVGVSPGSPAAAAGIRAGDLLLAVDGVPVSDTAALRRVIFGRGAGETSQLTVQPGSGATGTPGTPGGTGGAAGSLPPRDVSVLLESRLVRPGVPSLMLTYAGVGLMVLAVVVPLVLVRPHERAARVLFLAGAFGAIWPAVDLFYGGMRERWLPLGWDPVDQVGYLVALANAVAVLHLFLVFPEPRPIGRWVAALYGVPLGFAIALFAMHLSPVLVLWSLVVLVGLAAVTALGVSYVRPATSLARPQVRWVMVAVIVVVLVQLAGPLLQVVTRGRIVLVGWLSTVIVFGLMYLALALAVLRYRLFDVTLVLRATLLYPLLVGLITAAYVAASFVIGEAASRLLGAQAAADPSVRVLAALLVASAFHPLRRALQRALDRVVQGRQRALARFAVDARETLSRALPAEDVEALLTRDAVRALEVAGAWVVREPGTVADASSHATPALLATAPALLERMQSVNAPAVLAPPQASLLGAPVEWVDPDTPALQAWFRAGARLLVPLRAGDRLVGIWAVGTTRSPDLPAPEDFRTVEQIARQAALVLDYARLHEAHFAAQLSAQLAGERHKITQEFTSMVSHELRTPIRAIKGFSTAMLEAGAAMSDADRIQCLQHIGEASDELLTLVGTLLDYSLIRAGVFTVEPHATPVAPLVEAAVRQLRAARPSHRIETRIAPELPPVLADVKRVEQVLRNLLDNATKYAPAGTTVWVDVTYAPGSGAIPGAMLDTADAARGGDSLLISVSDEGAGIPAEELEQLFERYRRGQSARLSTVSGSGLGLTICRHLVEAHGGRIWAESPIPGRAPGSPPGMRVSFTLPTAEHTK